MTSLAAGTNLGRYEIRAKIGEGGMGEVYLARDTKLDRQIALKLEKKKYVMNYWLAISYTALGNKDAAFAELEKAYQAHDFFLQRVKVDPYMDPLRDDPRFNDLVKRLNFPQ